MRHTIEDLKNSLLTLSHTNAYTITLSHLFDTLTHTSLCFLAATYPQNTNQHTTKHRLVQFAAYLHTACLLGTKAQHRPSGIASWRGNTPCGRACLTRTNTRFARFWCTFTQRFFDTRASASTLQTAALVSDTSSCHLWDVSQTQYNTTNNTTYSYPIGNFFFAGARIFFRSLEAAIFLFSRVARLPDGSRVLPSIATEERITLGAQLADGSVIRGQNEISHPSVAGVCRRASSVCCQC